MSNSQKIEAALGLLESVLGGMPIPATWDNVNKVHTLYTILAEAVTDLKRMEQEKTEKAKEVEADGGAADAK